MKQVNRVHLMFLALIVAFSVAKTQAAEVTLEKASDAEFATFGLRVRVPSDWQRVEADLPAVIASWEWRKPVSVAVGITWEPRNDRSLDQFASDVAERLHATVSGQPVALGTTKGLRLVGGRIPTKPGQPGDPQECIVVVNAACAYLIMAIAGTAEAVPREQLDLLAKNVEFVEFTAPTTADSMRLRKIEIDNAAIELAWLPTLRSMGEKQLLPGVHLKGFRVMDLRQGPREELSVLIGVLPKGTPRKGIDEMAKSLAETMNCQWRELKQDDHRRMLSTRIHLRDDEKLGPDAYRRMALVQLSDSRIVNMTFILSSSRASDRDKYETTLEEMARSVREAPLGSN